MTNTPSGTGWLRNNAFVLAAVLLPVVVVGLFLIASAVPRWLVPEPQFDLLFSVDRGYDPSGPRVTTSFTVRDGRVEAEIRAAAPNTYPTRTTLYLFNHATGDVREVPVDPPRTLPEGDGVLTVGIPALSDRRVVPGETAPDGYEFEVRSSSAPGIVGELFGMRRYGQDVVLANRGRLVRLTVPSGPPYATRAIGWLEADGGR